MSKHPIIPIEVTYIHVLLKDSTQGKGFTFWQTPSRQQIMLVLKSYEYEE